MRRRPEALRYVAIMNITQRKLEIQRLVGADHIPKAIKRLMDFSTDFSSGRIDLKTIIGIGTGLNELDEEHAKGDIEKATFEEKRTALAKQILELTDEIETSYGRDS